MDSKERRVSAADLDGFARRALQAAGMPDDDAAITAEAMVWADLRGLSAHGVGVKLAQCIARIRAGGTRANPTLPALREGPATVSVDGQDAWGQVAATRGMRAAITKAKTAGVGVASVRDVSSAAALGYFPTLATKERMVGIALTNGPALIPAWGGTRKLLGNQAHAIGCPAGRHFPILFDSATTTMSTGEIDELIIRGELLPEGVLLTADGTPTRDPAKWREGVLLPMGGHRGYGLSLMFEVLTGVLAGGEKFAAAVGHPFEYEQRQGVGMFFLAIDPAISMPVDTFLERVDRLIDQVHASPRAPGVDRIYVPGERGYLTAHEHERDGIPLTADRLADLRTLADSLDIPGL